MRRRSPWFVALILLTSALIATPCFADRPAPRLGTASGPLHEIVLGEKQATASESCHLGSLGPGAYPMYYLYPPNDQYYTLIDPALCSCGEQGGALLRNAGLSLEFPEACTISVQIAIVAASHGDPNCPAIPALGAYLCGPISYDLTAEEPGLYRFELPLGSGCCVSEKVFLMVNFVSAGTCGSLPGLMIDGTNCGCFTFNTWPDAGGEFQDLCGAMMGSPVMFVETGCCASVPVVPQAWGQVKALYR